jgi:hypothetical protein
MAPAMPLNGGDDDGIRISLKEDIPNREFSECVICSNNYPNSTLFDESNRNLTEKNSYRSYITD